MSSVQPAQPKTPETPEQAWAWADGEVCRRSLKQFLMGCWHVLEPGTEFVDGWVIDALCEHLEALVHGDITRLVINIQPRTLKSTLCSVAMPVWAWLHSPEWRFLSASYSLSLSIRDNRRKRVLIESEWFQARYADVFKLAGDQNVKSFFENDCRGYQIATSIGGTTTGQGGDYLLIDDPHNASEAYSEADREAALIWFREVWSNRLNNQATGRMLTVGQRIHENDVCGYILRERKDWIGLILPSEFEPSRRCYTPVMGKVWKGTDPRTEEGELLWKDRFDQAALDGLKRDLGNLGYAAQYQQSPVPSTGGMFRQDWFRYFSETEEAYVLHAPQGNKSILKSACSEFGTLDLAISSKQEADYTVFAVWVVTPDSDLLLRFVARDHLDNAAQLRMLQSLHARFRPGYWKVETVAYQLAFFQQALAQGIPCREYKPVKDKVSRAATASVWSENGKTYFLAGASWLPDWEAEHLTFPKGAHDDQVDNHSMAAEEVCVPALPLQGVEPQEKTKPPTIAEIQKIDPFEWFESHGGWND